MDIDQMIARRVGRAPPGRFPERVFLTTQQLRRLQRHRADRDASPGAAMIWPETAFGIPIVVRD